MKKFANARTIIFDYYGVHSHKVLVQDVTMYKEYYLVILRSLHDAIHKNGQIYGRVNHEICTTIIHHLTRQSFFKIFYPKIGITL
jgi:hypothetical protein